MGWDEMEWSELLVGWRVVCLHYCTVPYIAFRSLSYMFFFLLFLFLSFFPLFLFLFSPYYKQNGVLLLLLLLLVARTKRYQGVRIRMKICE